MRLLSYGDLKEKGVNYSRMHLRRLVKAGSFPRPIKLGTADNAKLAWVESEVDGYITAKLAARDQAA